MRQRSKDRRGYQDRDQSTEEARKNGTNKQKMLVKKGSMDRRENETEGQSRWARKRESLNEVERVNESDSGQKERQTENLKE